MNIMLCSLQKHYNQHFQGEISNTSWIFFMKRYNIRKITDLELS